MSKLPKGFVWTLFGSGEDAGTVEIKAKGSTLATYRDVRHPFPITDEALAFAFRELSHTVTDVDGTEHTLEGITAAAAKYFQHACESVRGSIRTDLVKGRPVSDELAKQRFAQALSFGGKSGSGRTRTVAAVSELDGLSKEEIIALLKARGAVS